CLDSKPLFQAISASLRRKFGLDYVGLLMYDPEIRALRLQMLDFPEGAGVIREDAIVPMDDSVAGLVFRTREPRLLAVEDVAPISPATSDIMAREGLKSLCCVPIVSRGNA